MIFNKNASLIMIEKKTEPESLAIIPESSFAALKIWRARPGEIITVADSEGGFYRARLSEWTGNSAYANVFYRFPVPPENSVRIHVFQAIPEKERFELIIQKLTEMGVSCITPFVSEKSTNIEARDALQKKSHKWPEIVVKAAKQCRRAIIPELEESITWEKLAGRISAFDRTLILSEHNGGFFIGDAIKKFRTGSMAIIIGPEGGFTKQEILEAREKGAEPVSLGSRILRTETAVIVATAIVTYETGGFSC